ncbi:aminotransferase class III-fold pyridoxal phosphate-dependent enzyme [bacterium]|nr:aminotransferase class III-fold pyridoxal phosphate-dependent enzyme [bacterium]
MFAALAFLGMDVAEVEAEGWMIRTADGREFIDCLGGFGVYNFGHRHPRIVAAVKAQLDRMAMSSRLALNPRLAELAHRLAAITPGELQYTFVCNSGTEAVEAALKLARLATGKPGIISARNAFHGKTLGSLSSTHREAFQKPFLPLMQHFGEVPFGDLAALEALIDDSTAAVLLEPVQGEGGIHVAPDGYLAGVRELTRDRGVLLILDEIQTGIGRTGANFACEHWDVAPDIMTLAKALGGGVMPIGATIGTAAVWEHFQEAPTVHSSTFGGNQLACSAALAALDVLVDEKIAGQAQTKGARMLAGLRALAAEYPEVIVDVRGIGLMLGLEMAAPDISQLFIANMIEQQVIVAYTLNFTGVVRLEPPLVMPESVIDEVLVRIRAALDGTRQVMEQFGLAPQN